MSKRDGETNKTKGRVENSVVGRLSAVAISPMAPLLYPERGSALKCVGSCLLVCMCLTGAVAAVCPDPVAGR